MNPDTCSRAARTIYSIAAAINFTAYLYTRDINYLLITVLLAILTLNVKTIDGWRHLAGDYQQVAEKAVGYLKTGAHR